MPSVKGKLFEFFVEKILLFCGFHKVPCDNLIIFNGTAGTMIQGLGQPHNADVLLAPPIQTPFYYPTRLLIECKCYDEPIGLPIVRNVLGLREDINHFDVVTEEMLRNRKSIRSSGEKYDKRQKYNYQVAVASLNGYKNTAFPFAQAHRIPLISFSKSELFTEIRDYIDDMDRLANIDKSFAAALSECLKNERGETNLNLHLDVENDKIFKNFMEKLGELIKKTSIGILEDGTIIFLVKEDAPKDLYVDDNPDSKIYKIRWNTEYWAWQLYNKYTSYYFELPNELCEQWLDFFDSQKEGQSQTDNYAHRDFVSKIVLFKNTIDPYHYKKGDNEEIEIITLSDSCMKDMRCKLYSKS